MQPAIMSNQVSLHPLVVIVVGGSAMIGIIRAMVAVPTLSVSGAVIRFLTGRDPDHPRPPPFTIEPENRVAGDTW